MDSDEQGLPVVGVPKTIDNDVRGTDFTFGFDTAVQIACDAIDRLHTTAASHDRVMVVEVMGRNTGWIAVFSGIAGGADQILIPEVDITVEEVCRAVEKRHDRGKSFSIVVVAEGATLAFESGERRQILANTDTDEYGYPRLGGIGPALAREIENRTGFEARVTALGHVQRGGTPTATDRILATRYGIKAADLVREGKFGHMAALRGGEITSVPAVRGRGAEDRRPRLPADRAHVLRLNAGAADAQSPGWGGVGTCVSPNRLILPSWNRKRSYQPAAASPALFMSIGPDAPS